nr:hypothetical protein [Tanacetum cinerariifolium]
NDVACLMLGKMSHALQKKFESYPPQLMFTELKKIFEKPQDIEIYDLVDALHSYKQAPGEFVSAHVLEIKGYMDQLHALGKSFDNDMAINLINRGVVSLSCLLDLGFNHTIASNGISVSLNGLFYFSVVSVNSVFEIDMNNNVSKNNNNSIFSINKKRKLDLYSSYLWHCRLAHIGKTRMQKLQRKGLLESINDESFDKCESCISGKMSKKPFNNNIERAIDLLGLIHTDVCRPLRHVSRKGASYFLTSTDDFGRYGYVYLLKYKHEVFENFKVFKSEVELQLGKKIKALRSDRGGEYLSQEFKDYLSKNGIVQHLTSPYTPQQNGVSERRKHTLLDIVRSMFNLTTLPLSFSDYALESVVRILNMVPTNKGCEAYVKHDSADKLYQRSVLCIFVGYPKETMGYYFYFSPENEVIVARSKRTTRAPNRLCLNIEVEDDEIRGLRESANYKAAMLNPDKSKWLYKKKTDMDGKVHTYKARLVAKGCTQTYRIDCEEKFSPIAIRILIAIAAYYDYEIWQMDVKTAFLNGRLDKDIYMEQPERSDVVFLILYVDDILIMGNNIPRLKEVKDYHGKCFSMKELGEAAYILGIKIYRDRSKRLIGLSQSAYIDKILKKYNIHNSKKGYLPMKVKHDLSNELCASIPEKMAYMKKVPYASAVGSIMYVVRCIRPDMAFAQNIGSRYQQNPGKLYWVAVKHILKYLRNMRDMFLVYGGKPDTKLDVTCFCNASWQCDKDDMKSQTSYVFFVNGGAVDWKSKKQTTIEYVAASEAAMGTVWIRKFAGYLGVMPLINKPINMYCDNSAAIIFANEPGIMKGAKHFLRRYHYVREQVDS